MNIEERFIRQETFEDVLSLLKELRVSLYLSQSDKLVILNFSQSAILNFEFYLLIPLIKKSFFQWEHPNFKYLVINNFNNEKEIRFEK